MKKKILAILLTSVMCFSTAVPVFANTEVTTLDNTENQFLDEILRYVPCTGGGKHAMYGRGACTGYKGSASGKHSVLFKGGLTTQCSKCM